MHARLSSFVTAAALLATSFMPMAVHAATADVAISPGDLVKCASLSSVYYFAPDGKRYVFPNEKTYFTWYKDFSTVKTISDARCSTLPLGRGNITYRPGVKMVKITTDPRTYVVEAGGILAHVTSEQLAQTFYGLNWKNKIDDVPDAFYSNYKNNGLQITDASQYVPNDVMNADATIMADKHFDDTTATVSIGSSSIGFVPLTMTVKKGTAVMWVNRDIVAHQVKGDAFDSGSLAPDATYSHTFNSVGSFKYSDPVYPANDAVINVQ
jgi:plastocyanin